MSTASSELRAVAKRIAQMPKEMVRIGAKELQRPLNEAAARDSGGDRRLSGLRNSGLLTASTSVRDAKGETRGRVYAGQPRMRAPWSWLDRGTKPRRQGRGRHPGTPAKGTWTRTADRETERVMRAMVARWDQENL